jgi:tRNA (guanosine-2'-O-)-methyltransferase
MDTVLANRIESVALGLEDLNKSYNAIACLRTAESFGLQDVVAIEALNEYPIFEEDNPYVPRKVTAYAHRWIDLHRQETPDGLFDWARDRDMRMLGTSPHAEMTLDDVSLDGPILVLFGNEKAGLRPETAARCDDVFRLPMYGFTESFNLSVTVGMTLSALTGRVRRRLEEEGRTGDMSEARKQWLLASWLVSSVRAAEPILRRELGPKKTN